MSKFRKKPISPNVTNSNFDFSKLKEVDENSIEAKLFSLIDDIDTATDMFKPEMNTFENYVIGKIKEARRLITSDGYKLYYVEKTS